MIPNYGAARDKYERTSSIKHGVRPAKPARASKPAAPTIAYRKARSEAYERISQENGTETAPSEAWDVIMGSNLIR